MYFGIASSDLRLVSFFFENTFILIPVLFSFILDAFWNLWNGIRNIWIVGLVHVEGGLGENFTLKELIILFKVQNYYKVELRVLLKNNTII